jgi:hypothetical protein
MTLTSSNTTSVAENPNAKKNKEIKSALFVFKTERTGKALLSLITTLKTHGDLTKEEAKKTLETFKTRENTVKSVINHWNTPVEKMVSTAETTE